MSIYCKITPGKYTLIHTSGRKVYIMSKTPEDHIHIINKLKDDHKLTYRQAAFAYYFTGNNAAAARSAGYKGSVQALSIQGKRNLDNAKVISAIQARTAGKPDTILSPNDLMAHWTSIINDPLASSQAKAKASESLARSHAMFTDKSISLNYNKSDRIDQLTDTELNELLSQTIKSLLDHKVISPDQLAIDQEDQGP